MVDEDVGGVKLRLGLRGALVPHKGFDNGDGNATIAGGQGTRWTAALRIGELVGTVQQVFDHNILAAILVPTGMAITWPLEGWISSTADGRSIQSYI